MELPGQFRAIFSNNYGKTLEGSNLYNQGTLLHLDPGAGRTFHLEYWVDLQWLYDPYRDSGLCAVFGYTDKTPPKESFGLPGLFRAC